MLGGCSFFMCTAHLCTVPSRSQYSVQHSRSRVWPPDALVLCVEATKDPDWEKDTARKELAPQSRSTNLCRYLFCVALCSNSGEFNTVQMHPFFVCIQYVAPRGPNPAMHTKHQLYQVPEKSTMLFLSSECRHKVVNSSLQFFDGFRTSYVDYS
jgi:hypothetical protein